MAADSNEPLTRAARTLRVVHHAVGVGELACLGYLWVCALTRRRDRWLGVSIAVLLCEGVALAAARECPMGALQRRAGDDVAMFELWFGPALAPFAIPVLTALSAIGIALVVFRRPRPTDPVGQRLSQSAGSPWALARA